MRRSLARRHAALLLIPLALALPLPCPAPPNPKPETPNQKLPDILLAIADDWSWPHAGAYGDKVVKTPHVDRLARGGVLFSHAFCAAPSCSPSRAALLTGQAPHRLEEGGNLWSTLPRRFETYPDLLEAAGYAVGFARKGWGPGDVEAGGRSRNPAGAPFGSFESFLKSVPKGKPFCFWFGSQDPHRPYDAGSGAKAGLRPEDAAVPLHLPDLPDVRADLLDYHAEVQRFDRALGEMLVLLESAGRLDNTLVVVTSDNGMPVPRAKANLYDAGCRVPLVVHWPARAGGGRALDAFVNLADLAPTFLEAAGLKSPEAMTARSLLPLLRGEPPDWPDRVFLERERHAHVRKGNLGYPARAVRTREFLYVRNLRPDRWPAGDPEHVFSVGPFGDTDDSPTKRLLLDGRADPALSRFFRLAFEKRPEEELYDLRKDPGQIENVAGRPGLAAAQAALRASLDRWMAETSDPRAAGDDDRWDRYPYYGKPAR